MTKSHYPPHLLLHTMLMAFSYWGTAVRILLVGFLLCVAILLTSLEGSSSTTSHQYIVQFIYLIGSLLLLDAGYVTIARALPISTEIVDKVIFLLFLAALSAAIVLPYFASVPSVVIVSVKWVFLVSLFVLALRLVLGFFLGHRAEKR